MLFFALTLACGSDEAPAPAAGPERRHHAAVPDGVEPADEEVRAAPIGNRAPVIRNLQLQPANADVTRTLKATVDAKDPDGDDLDVDYVWQVDGQDVSGAKSAELALEDFRRGAQVVLEVTVTDPGGQLASTRSPPVTIGNADPRFLTDPKQVTRIDGLRVEAEDPDGDAVTFRLEGAPAGVTLDPRGYLHYVGSETEKGGSYRMKLFAEDGAGGQARMELPLELSAGSKGQPVPAGVPQ